jgi:hypothetical protein
MAVLPGLKTLKSGSCRRQKAESQKLKAESKSNKTPTIAEGNFL